jgi:arsenite methyltransferase
MNTIPNDPTKIRDLVQKAYAETAKRGGGCCEPSCCDGDKGVSTREQSQRIGYDAEQLDSVPEEANLGVGCGNPTALASLKEGETVIDLGSGGGLDAFLAAQKVGASGRVIGIDMTPEMLARARKNAVESGVADRVEFREGLIEKLPVVSDSVDVVISNCVVNLSPDKPQVFREAFRVLKPGGRLAVSDILLGEPLPEDIAALVGAYVGCIGGAIVAEEYFAGMRDAGFVDIDFSRVSAGEMFEGAIGDPTMKAAVDAIGIERVREVAQSVFSYKITARKP